MFTKFVKNIPLLAVVMLFLLSVAFGCLTVVSFIFVLTKSSIPAFVVGVFSFLMGAASLWTAGNIDVDVEYNNLNKFDNHKY